MSPTHSSSNLNANLESFPDAHFAFHPEILMPLSFLNPLPEGRVRVVLLALGFMCVSSSALIGRTAGDALFLERYSLSGLSYMYMGTAVVVGSVAFVYGLFAGRIAITRLISIGVGALVAGLIALRVGLATPHSGYRIAAYFIGDLVVNVPMILFWSFAAMLFNPREAKRVFGFVGAGGTFACIFAGFAVKPFAAHFGAANLLFICAGLLMAFVAIVLSIARREAARFQAPPAHGRRRASGYYTTLLQSRQVRSLALLVFATHIALTLIDYQFKAGARLHHSPDQLAGFFGNFYGFSSVIALFIQLFLVHRILQKGGVQLGLVLLPASLLIGSMGTALSGQFGWMVATKFAVQIFLFTIDTAAIQMLYLGIPVQTRNQARAFIEGIGKPIAIAITGLGLIGAAAFLPLSILAVGAGAAIAFWLWLARVNHKAYVTALIDSLGSRRFDPSQETEGIQDKTVSTHIKQAIDEASDEEIVYLLGLTSTLDTINWTPEYRRLLQRNSPEVKIEALNYLKTNGDESDLPAVKAQIGHAQPAVRAAAVRTLSQIGGTGAAAHIEGALGDPSPDVRAAAIAALINSGDLDHLINAGVALKAMLESPEVTDRVAAADALAGIRGAALLRPLAALLQDADNRVRKAALKASRTHADPRLIPAITALLSDPSVAGEAVGTLAACGSRVIDHLLPHLEIQDGKFEGAHLIPDVLVAIGDLSVLPRLLKTAETPDIRMRHNALRAYCRLVQTAPAIKPYREILFDWARREIALAQERRQQYRALAQTSGGALLMDALQEASEAHQDNAIQLLTTALPEVNLQAVFAGLRTAPGANRANALEILDNVLPKSVKSHVLNFYEDLSPPLLHTGDISAEEIYPFLTGKESAWIASGALVMLIEKKWPLPDQTLAPCLNHAQAVVRETALYALRQSADPEAFRAQANRLANDPDPAVRRLACALIC